jgi:hypothetical protein
VQSSQWATDFVGAKPADTDGSRTYYQELEDYVRWGD